MYTQQQTFAASQIWEMSIPGSFFAIMATSLGVNVRFYKKGQMLDLGEVKNVQAGLEVKIDSNADGYAFDKIQIDVQAGDTVQIGIGNGQARYNRSFGSVSVLNNNGAYTNTQKTVANATGQLVAANASRRYLLIQNKDAAGNIWISFGAGAATTANGIKIAPGGSYVAEVFTTNQAIQAIGDIASNANIVVVEGQ